MRIAIILLICMLLPGCSLFGYDPPTYAPQHEAAAPWGITVAMHCGK